MCSGDMTRHVCVVRPERKSPSNLCLLLGQSRYFENSSELQQNVSRIKLTRIYCAGGCLAICTLGSRFSRVLKSLVRRHYLPKVGLKDAEGFFALCKTDTACKLSTVESQHHDDRQKCLLFSSCFHGPNIGPRARGRADDRADL